MTPPPPPHRRRYILTASLALAAALSLATAGLAGCGSSGETASSPAVDAAGQPAGGKNDSGAEVAPPAVANDQKEGGSPQQAPAPAETRSLIYTGTMAVKVKDVTVAADKAVDIAAGQGGTVGADRRTLNADRSEAELILRVPSEKFAATLNELGKLGVEESRSVQTQDVTEALVDLDARLATQRASVDRVRALLAKAQSIGEVVSIESELTRREADLASLEQRKEKLSGLVALSTITVDLRGPAAPSPAGEVPDSGFVAGLKNGWAAFGTSIRALLIIAGWLLPWAVAIGVPLWLVLFLLRRRATPTPHTAVPQGAAAPATPAAPHPGAAALPPAPLPPAPALPER